MSMDVSTCDVLLVTVTDIETDAVRDTLMERHNRAFQPIFREKKTYRDLGVIGQSRTMLVRSEMGSASSGGSLQTVSRGIADLKPIAVVMLGIAFGIDPVQQQIGDILVSRQLMLYELQRVGTDAQGAYQIRARGDKPSASDWLIDRLRAARDTWNGAPLHFGCLLSGDKLIDNQDFRAQLTALEPEAIGGDMEGAGLYVAAQDQKADWIVVKAISDWADGKKYESKQEYQRLAAKNAAKYVFHVLEQGGIGALSRSSTGTVAQLSLTQLRLTLTERLDREEIQAICFDLGIDYDNIPGSTKSARVRELLAYLSRRNELEKLLAWIQKHRSDIQ